MSLFDGNLNEGQRRALEMLRASSNLGFQSAYKRLERSIQVGSVGQASQDFRQLISGPWSLAYTNDPSISDKSIIIGLRPTDSPKYLICCGLPDTGKSTLFYSLGCEHVKYAAASGIHIPVIFFNHKNEKDGRRVCSHIARAFPDDTLLLRVRGDSSNDFIFNPPFPPHPRMSDEEWFGAIAYTLGTGVFGFRYESTSAVRTSFQKARSGVPGDVYPCFYDAYLAADSLHSNKYRDKSLYENQICVEKTGFGDISFLERHFKKRCGNLSSLK